MAKNKTVSTDTKENETPVVNAPVAPAKPAESTSEKLTELKAKKIELQSAAMSLDDNSTDGEKDEAFMAVYKIGEEIKSELAAIKKEEAALLVKEKQAAIVAMFDDAVDAKIESVNEPNDSENKQSLYDNAKALREIVINKLLGSVPRSTGTTKTATTGGSRGATKQAILDLITPMYANATTDNVGTIGSEARRAAIHDNGFNDGTANAAILEYEKSLGLK